jgi:Spy/CpxP family protein refolding chaperone
MKYLLASKAFFRNLVVVCLFASISMVASAQSQDDEKPDHKGGPKHLIEALDITADQEDSFTTIMDAQHEKRMSIREQYRDIHEEERSLMTSLDEDTLTLLQDVLTTEQLETFASMEKQKPQGKPRH